MIAVPSWKAEFLEKKKRNERKDNEVPLWKRELLKRLHSKKMSEESHTDIVEEHIPKVSDNIFLVHEKKQYRHASAPRQKSVIFDSHQISPKTSVSAVENVIIIEKQASEEKTENHDDGVFARESEEKDYPSVGLVHRLMDRFQRSTNTSNKKSKFQAPRNQRSKSSDILQRRAPENHTPASVTSPPHSPGATRSHSASSDSMAPLLISTPKPFSRHASPSDHGYHHVNLPIRRVTAPKSPSSERSKPPESEKQEEIHSNNVEDSFTSDMSNLHSNQDAEKPITFPKESSDAGDCKVPSKQNHVELVNGESLHSSGNAQPEVIILSESTETFTNEYDYAEKSTVVTEDNNEMKVIETIHIKETWSNTDVIAETNDVMPEAHDKGATFDHAHITTQRNSQDETKDTREEKQKTASVKDLLRKMEPSKPKPFKVPQPARYQQQNGNTTFSSAKPKLENKNFDKLAPSSRTKIPVETEPPRNGDLPSTVIDDIIIKPPSPARQSNPLVITPVDALPVSETKVDKKVEPPKRDPSPPKKVPPRETISIQSTTVIRPKATPVINNTQRTSSNPSPKFTNIRQNSVGGTTFVINPRRNRRSAAPPINPPPSNVLKETSNNHIIKPKDRSGDVPLTNIDANIEAQKTSGKRKLTADQIQVIGGYVSLERSCLIKESKRKKKGATITFSEKSLETTYEYVSERSLLDEAPAPALTKTPGFKKDGEIGKYTPKYLLSMKDIPDEENEQNDVKSPLCEQENANNSNNINSFDPTPLSDENAVAWSGTTSDSTDILF